MVDYRVQGKVAVLELNSPPVNALSHHVRAGIQENIRKAIADPSVTCIVISGKNNTFCAGADIKEFTGAMKGPWITEVGHEMELCKKPVVAAIHGTALGGGLEVALFCNYRIAVSSARVGFPEVQIGILPGAGGTQRLPRVAGLKTAIDLITSGRHVYAKEAMALGIIDKVVVSGDIINEGIKFALSKVNDNLEFRRLRNRPVMGAQNVKTITEEAINQVKKKYKGVIAPVVCVKAIQASAELPYEAGMVREQELFQQLSASGQARALQYAFFAERVVSRWRLPSGGSYQTAKPYPVKTAAVLGAGTMGNGIALSLVTSGIPTILVEREAKFLENGVAMMKSQLAGTVRLGKLTQDQAKKAMSLLTPVTEMEKVKDVDLIIEAVFEDLALKRDIFARLDKMCKPSTLLCSNTSSLDIDKLAEVTNRPDKVVGTHFFAPPYIMKLLENVYGSKTSPDTVATVMKLGKTIKKVPVLVGTCFKFVANRMSTPHGQEVSVVVGTCFGFVANRMLGRYTVEGRFVVEEGALPQEVDQVLEDFGMPMGTFKVSDLSGLDIGYKIARENAKSKGINLTLDTRLINGERHSSLSDRLVEMGRLGIKSGRGWYKYEKPGARAPVPDPEVTEIIEKHCRDLGITRRTIGSQEILERMQYSMINEGFKILEDGICSKPEEIDVIWIYGFGWPKYMGGPMFYASQIGLKKVYERICYYHQKFPYSFHWLPSSLLAKLSDNEVPFSQWAEVATGYSSRL